MNVLSHLKPEPVFRYFELLSSVPHGSGNTKQISDLVVAIAREFPFAVSDRSAVQQDDANNVIIRKPASPGCESAPAVILQGHLDMVCAKEPNSPLDMAKEPIRLCTDGTFVYAEGTSLGGDDLIAASIALAILEDDSLVHPALEVVLTTDEEIGMLGAAALDCSGLKGRMLLNLDSESWGVMTAGCAGGVRVHGSIQVDTEPTQPNQICYRSKVCGRLGGHSGEEIDKERGNANILLGRILFTLRKQFPFRIADFVGGLFDNVICPLTECSVTIPADMTERFITSLSVISSEIREELAASDSGFSVSIEKTDSPISLTDSSTDTLLDLLVSLPNGVQAMNYSVPGAVQTSLNLGKTKLEKDRFTLDTLIRSSLDTQKKFLLDKVTLLIRTFGGNVTTSGDYPAWQFRRESLLRDLLQECYRELMGSEASVEVIHAGVECGLLSDKIPGLDAVSLGPDLYDIHSPNEKMSVESVQKTWELVCAFLSKTSKCH